MADQPIAFQGAVMLAGWSESHTQGCRVTFWLEDSAALDPFRFATVRKGKTAGQRYMMVLVEVDTDEQPVQHPSNAAHLKLTSDDFLEYAQAQGPKRDDWDPMRAKEWAKYAINIDSLSQLDTDPAALERYHRQIVVPFSKWLHRREIDGDDDLRHSDGMDVK